MAKTAKPTIKAYIDARLHLYCMTRTELAAAMGISVRTLENRMADPEQLTLRELRAIARKLHCSIAMLAGEAPCDM